MVITATVYCQNVYVVTKTTDPNPFEHKFDNIDSLCDPEIYGTLQWAINKVNSNSGDSRIEFNIPGAGPHEIILNYYLPQIKNATIIDGSTQNGYSYGNPQIIINAQHKHNSIFDVYSTNITIKGLKLTSFAQNGILLHDCSNSLVFENIIYNYSTTSSKTSYSGLFINGCQNVEVYGNNIEVALDETVDPVTKSYGIYLSKSVNCTIGGTDVSMTNTIKNCRNYGVFSRSSQQIKISGNIIFDCEKAIYLDASNDNIQPPIISEYTNGILSGSSLPHSTIEIFGSTGAENANEYLESVIADENGDWGVELSTTYEYFSLTQTDINNNTSTLKTQKACISPFIIVESSDELIDEVWHWGPPGSNNPVISKRYLVCQDFEPLIIYDEGIKNLLANPNNPPIPIIHWWCGEECDWGNGFFCNNLPPPDEIEDQIGCELHRYYNGPIYGHYIIFDPQQHEPGEYIINAQYNSCELRRILIEVLEAPDATITPVDPVCLNDSPINLTAASSGGVWSGTGITNSTNGTFDPSVADEGTHEIIYTIDDQYCPSADTIYIEVVPIPDITATNNGECVGQDVVFTSSSNVEGLTYTWSSNTGYNINNPHDSTFTIPNAQLSHNGTYILTVEDQNGCTNETDTELELHEVQVNITANNNAICNYEPVTLYASEGWSSYIWSTGENTQSIVVSNPDSYSVTVTDAYGCTGSDVININSSYLEIKAYLITHTCEGENNGSVMQATDGNNPPFTFEWTGPNGFTANTESIFNLYAGEYHVTVTDYVGCEITATYIVEESFITLITSNSNPILCINEGESGSSIISVEATDGFEPYIYSWDNDLGNENTHTVYPNNTTTYGVTVTDSIGCTASAEFTVTVTELVLVIKGSEHAVCLGDSATLDAHASGANIVYSWSPAASLDNPYSDRPTASPSETTLYTVTATDTVTNCSATGTSLVIVHPLPVITVSAPDEACPGDEIQLEAFGAVTYHWETSSSSAIISDTEIANPTVTITETTTFIVSGWNEFHCKGFTEITINVLDNPTPIINGNEIVCLGDNLELTISNFVENDSCTWEGPNGFTSNQPDVVINNVTNLNQGLYTVTVTHTNGCSASGEIYVNTHSFTAYMENNNPCVGDELQLVARPEGMVSYHWEGQNSLNETTDVYQLIIPNADLSMAGTYYVTITDQYGCTASAQTEVIIHENPEVNLGSDIIICPSESVELSQNLTITGGTPDYNYEWVPVDWLNNYLIQNPIATPQTTTTYTLTVTDNHGCTGSDAITVAVDQIVGLTATYNTPVCQYTQLQLFAQPDGVDYLWTGPNGFTSNEQNPIVTTTAHMSNSGTYTLAVATPNECSSTISIEVEIHAVPVIFNQNLTVCEGSTLTLTSGIDGLTEYLWTGPNGFVSNMQNPIVSTNTSIDMQGIYILTVTNEFGCTASAVSNVEVIPTPLDAEFSLPDCIYINNNYEFTNLGYNDDSFHYTWNFGDDTTSNQVTPNHTFLNQGYHCITLTVENQCGISSYTPEEPVFLYPNECACITNYGLDDNLFITGSNEFWDPTINTVKKDIIIEPDAKLTIDGQTIQFGPEGRIIVKPKGELFINNSSTLQGLESCNNMWQGIEVWGNPMYESESSEQGRVKVAAGENKIKDAHIGILVGARNMDNICDFDLLSAFNSEYSGGYIGNKQSLNFINNGIGIKLLKKYPGGYPGTGTDGAYQMMSFETESGGLLDLNYNSVSGASPYPNIHNPWAGKANSLQRTDAGIWMEGIKFYKLYNSKFTNVQYGILAYNSCLNVIKTNFDNAVYGVRIENSNSELNSGYNIEGCEFKNIIGTGDDALEDFTSAGIFINSSLNTEIHGNIFGIEESPQSENNIGIFTLNSLSMNIYQNKFKNMKKGIFTSNIIITSIFPLMVDTDLPTNKIGAGLKTYYDITGLENWDGNSFEKCNTSVYTFLFNTNLILKCNNCKNDDVNLGAYYVNFKNEGFMANIGAPPQQQSTAFYNSKRPGGNEFTPDYPFYNGFYKTIMSNTEYEYYAHQGPSKVIPTSHNESEIDMSNHIHTSTQQKPANNIACPPPIYLISFPVSLPLVIVEPNGAKNYPYKYLDSLKNNIDSLSFVREDIRQNLDNGKTQELLNDIYGNMSNGRLKNKLIANSPLSDTVLYALMSEYPLSHGNFKNVMTINLPVSKNLTSLFYNVMAQIPQGISKQLIPLQGVNFNYQNITSLNREIEHLNLERGFVLNQLLNRLTDSVNNRRDDALLLLELENTDWAKATLVASYIEDGQYSHAREKLLQIQSNDPLAQDFIDYQNMMLDIYEDNRTVYQMDSTEIAFIRELAYKCPAGIASTNAQAILSLLYRENVPICPTMVGTKSIRINNNNNINDDKYNKPILDIILGDNYPDPASDYTIIPYYLPEDTDGIMEIYDAMGKVIAIYNLYQGDNQLNIDTKNLRPGIYTYTLITKEHGTISKKFIIYK